MTNEKNFIEAMLFIAIPVALQNLITSSINTVDTVMISTLGDASIAGVGLANQFFFFYFMICFGIVTGSAVLLAQYWGRRDWEKIQSVISLSVTISLIIGLIFTLISIFFAENILALMIEDPEVIRAGSLYLKVVSLSYIPSALSFAYGTAFRTTGNPQTPLMSTIISLLTNVFFNYVLIFGALGFPKLGIVGAALGTVIARLAEFAVMYYISRTYLGPLNMKVAQLFTFDRELFPRYLKTTSPVIINETFWSLGQVLYNIAYAMIGTESAAAVQVVIAIQNMALVIVRGLSSACSVMIGEKVGQDRFQEAQEYAIKYFKISILLGSIIGLLVAVTAPLTLQLFSNISPTVYQLAHKSMMVMAFVILNKSFTSILIVGVLRGGGDTKFSMYVEMFCVWFIGVPLAFIGAGLLKLPVYWVIALVGMEDISKGIIGFIRVRSGRWIRNVTN